MLTPAITEQMRLLLAGQAPATQALQIIDGSFRLRFDQIEVLPEPPSLRLSWRGETVVEVPITNPDRPASLTGFTGSFLLDSVPRHD